MSEEILNGIKREDIQSTRGFQSWLKKSKGMERKIAKKKNKETMRLWNSRNKNSPYRIVNKYLYMTLLILGFISLIFIAVSIVGILIIRPYIERGWELYTQNSEVINSFITEYLK